MITPFACLHDSLAAACENHGTSVRCQNLESPLKHGTTCGPMDARGLMSNPGALW